MHTCSNCGSVVSTDFVRVFGRPDGSVDACHACLPRTDVVGDRVVFGPP